MVSEGNFSILGFGAVDGAPRRGLYAMIHHAVCLVVVAILLTAHETRGDAINRRRCGQENMEDFAHLLTKDVAKEELCLECEAAMRAFRGQGFEYMYEEFKKLCKYKRSQEKGDDCIDSLEMYKEEVRHIMLNLNVSDSEACKFVLQCGTYTASEYKWEVSIPGAAYEAQAPTVAGPAFSVLHLTDMHVSTQYEVGASFDCEAELCCSDQQRDTATPETAAGPFGDIRGISYCDIPMRTLKSLLKNAQSKKFDYVYLTGDFIPHTSHNYSFERVINEIADQTEVIGAAFPDRPIVPCIGNHDDYPSFLFPTHKMQASMYSVDKLYNALWKLWSPKWIPEDQAETFKKGGYFTVKLQPNLRIFSLNTIYCYQLNWWLAVNPKDPEDQLQWLLAGLEAAAKNGEQVHILGHVPPGTTECIAEWAEGYQRIISRFRNVITGQYFGHMHWDMFSVDYDPDATENVPTGVQFVGPSATTYMTGYPSYRIMHYDEKTQLQDMDTYLLNITMLNNQLDVKPRDDTLPQRLEQLDNGDTSYLNWTLQYSYKDLYNMKDLSTASFGDLVTRMETDGELLQKYYRAFFQHREDPSNVQCEAGRCQATFYYKPGTSHAIVCEMYSRGSRQFDDCNKRYA